MSTDQFALYDQTDHIHRIRDVIGRITYRLEARYRFVIEITDGMKYPYLQLRHYRPDSDTGVMAWGGGGKAYITQWATDSEILQTALALALAYDAHEVREDFLVDGKRPFGPHIDTNALIEVCDRLDVRP